MVSQDGPKLYLYEVPKDRPWNGVDVAITSFLFFILGGALVMLLLVLLAPKPKPELKGDITSSVPMPAPAPGTIEYTYHFAAPDKPLPKCRAGRICI